MHTLKVLLPPLICSWETVLRHPDGVLRGSVDGTVVDWEVCASPLWAGDPVVLLRPCGMQCHSLAPPSVGVQPV